MSGDDHNPSAFTTRQRCAIRCQPKPRGNPWAEEGDVRRCEHGAVWICTRRDFIDAESRWRRVSRFWEPITCRRALAALDPARGEVSS